MPGSVPHRRRAPPAGARPLLSAGLLLALGGLAGLTGAVLAGETDRFDREVLLWMEARGSPGLDVAALKVTALGDTLVVFAIAGVAATLLWLLGRRTYAALLVAAVAGARVVNPLLKLAVDRPRPGLFEWRTPYAGDLAYPSGHASISMALLVALAYVVHRLSDRPWIGAAAALVAAAGVLGVGLSRLYLGVHYPSDVLAGYLVGFAWAVLCALGAESIRRRRRERRRGGNPRRPREGATGESHP